ncbi:2-hydroxyacid dehydrogenase [Thiohalophilus thiocyanatoxydans]|uniref:Glycerate dehydrogenase n=1 Tax=Thiohalophilus thiocyanatoxydans TaxID=381308 RepID=A0A4R8IL72_9GAMM|nr:2-hydroxyacid dehydrogenase [Thiohalophilus thiocyanatoxydans]TDY01532.1 glycerate dehydrogenase [Thiohalophilus thiocyanatoxydans]
MAAKRRGVFVDTGSLTAGGMAAPDLDFSAITALPIDWQYYPATDPDQVVERLQGAAVVVTNKVVLDAQRLAQLSDLELIAVAATGVNNVDLDAARNQGVGVCNVTGYATPSVVQHVFMLILSLSRRLPAYTAALRQGHWQQSPHFCLLDHPIEELQDKTLGIIGYGELGRAVARMGEAFGMHPLIARRDPQDQRPGRIDLAELLQQADVVSLHCPLSEQTRGLIGAEQLALMKPGAMLINTARGGIVDEPALYEALANGRLGGAGIDVLEREPPDEENPLLQARLENLIVTPHIAWASRAARQRLLDQVARNIDSWLRGGPLRNPMV